MHGPADRPVALTERLPDLRIVDRVVVLRTRNAWAGCSTSRPALIKEKSAFGLLGNPDFSMIDF